MITPTKVNKVMITLSDRDDTCLVKVEIDPPLTEEDTLEGSQQPCLLIAYAILAALQDAGAGYETPTDGSAPFTGMRPLK